MFGEDEVLREFCLEAHSGGTAIIDLFTHRVEEREDPVKDGLVTTDHECQVAALGAGSGAGDRGVEKIDTLGFQCLADVAALADCDGAAIDDR